MPNFDVIDHLAGLVMNMDLEPTVDWYFKMLDFHRFYSLDDSIIHTESSIRSHVVADFDEVIKMVIAESTPGKRKSQI